jgi:hypothetical protein
VNPRIIAVAFTLILVAFGLKHRGRHVHPSQSSSSWDPPRLRHAAFSSAKSSASAKLVNFLSAPVWVGVTAILTVVSTGAVIIVTVLIFQFQETQALRDRSSEVTLSPFVRRPELGLNPQDAGLTFEPPGLARLNSRAVMGIDFVGNSNSDEYTDFCFYDIFVERLPVGITLSVTQGVLIDEEVVNEVDDWGGLGQPFRRYIPIVPIMTTAPGDQSRKFIVNRPDDTPTTHQASRRAEQRGLRPAGGHVTRPSLACRVVFLLDRVGSSNRFDLVVENRAGCLLAR